MATINLKDFYPWYMHDEFVEVADEIVAELLTGRRQEKAYRRRTYYNKAHYSIDVNDDIAQKAIVYENDSPERIFDLMERHCSLCRALNCLPEIQGRRIEAHFLYGISQRDIAKAEGVNERNVRRSIRKGLASMKKYLESFKRGCPNCPSESHDI